MAGSSSDLTFRLFGKDVSASKSLKAFESQAGHTERSVKGIGTGAIAVGSMLGSLGAMGVTALVGVAASAVTTGVTTAAAMEQAQIGFSQLIGSTQQAETFLARLSDFAASTPFEMPGLIDSSRLLLGVGVAAGDVIPMLTAFGDAAGAVGIQQDAFQRIMLAMSQSISAGTLKLGDMNQLMNNGLPIWKLLSEALGMPVSKIQDLISHGKLLTKDVLPKLQAQMEKDYGGAMAKQSQTLSGLWSTLSDTFSQGMAKVLVPMLPTLKKLATQGIALLAKAFTWLAATGPTVSSALGTVGNFVSTVLWPALQTAWAWIQNTAIPVIKNLAAQFMQNIWPAIQMVASMVAENLQPAIVALAEYWSGSLWPAIQRMIPVLATVAKFIGIVVGVIVVLTSWILGKLIPVVYKIIGVFVTVFSQVMSTVAGAVEWVINHFGSIVTFITTLPGKISSAASGMWDGIKNSFRSAVNWIISRWNDLSFTVGGGEFMGKTLPSVTLDTPNIPMLANGGIVTRPTLALIGERGAEAVIPLGRRGVGDTHVHFHGGTFVGTNYQRAGRDLRAALGRATASGY